MFTSLWRLFPFLGDWWLPFDGSWRRVLLLALLMPGSLSAQLEFGIDSGIRIQRTVGANRTTFRVPSEWLRVGIRGQRISFESLINFAHARLSGQSATQIEFIPGFAYNIFQSYYVRGEVGMLLLSQENSSASQFAYGIAVGTKYPLGTRPFYVRLETGFDRWVANGDFFESREFRLLVGLTVMVN